ncbi:MAG TPA: FkbM family methyltransferase [Verrucomicrobiae bacterium]|jgi:FkbM family methyltransferase|nr:FkbM family methyltransferase [Verrucomicrobiae bacterium]
MKPTSIADRTRSFFYRRLARFVTCEVKLAGDHPLALDNKFQVNSLQDVFCHPFYWQLYGWLTSAPRLVVDLGAHCGHFSMLADVCVRLRFENSAPEYLLVEPNPDLIPVIRRNLEKSGLCSRHTLKQGLVGDRCGAATLWVSPRNYLSASLQPGPATRGVSANYFDLEGFIGDRKVDLLKVDIEGAEYALVANYPEFLKRVGKVMIEIHSAPEPQQRALVESLQRAGLRPAANFVNHGHYQLAMFERP